MSLWIGIGFFALAILLLSIFALAIGIAIRGIDQHDDREGR